MGDEKKTIRGASVAGIAVSALLTACGAAQTSDEPAPVVAETEAAAGETPEAVESSGDEAGEEEGEAEDPPYNAGGGRG